MDLEKFLQAEEIVKDMEELGKMGVRLGCAAKISVNLTLQDENGSYIKGVDLPESVCSLLKKDILGHIDDLVEIRKKDLGSV